MMRSLLALVFGLLLSIIYVKAYNISPFANIIHSKPLQAQVDSPDAKSYFGFSLLLRKSSLLVGSPRSNSTLSAHRSIEEPGLMYMCSVSSNESCNYITIEPHGNIVNKNEKDSEIRQNQWMGASLSGDRAERYFMTCAPRIKTEKWELATGSCYINHNKSEGYSKKIKAFDILDEAEGLSKADPGEVISELGFATAYIEERQTFIAGIPTISRSSGAIVRYDLPNNKLELNRKLLRKDSYLGFAVAAGTFDKNGKISYVISAPRYNDYGTVVLVSEQKFTTKEKQIDGQLRYDFFGYEVLSEDVNGDGVSELFVAAPFYSEPAKQRYEAGAVYVYTNENNYKSVKLTIVAPGKGSRGRFGTSLAQLGDINLDGFNDIAVGAPFEGDGKVYIYHGSADGVLTRPAQTIEPPLAGRTPPSAPNGHRFGYTISSGSDIDANHVNDIAISAINIDKVFVYRSYPIIRVNVTIDNLPQSINFTNSLDFETCIRFRSLAQPFDGKVSFNLSLSLDYIFQRVKLRNSSMPRTASFMLTLTNDEYKCISHSVEIDLTHTDKPFLFELNYKLIQPEITEKFCTDCVILHMDDRYKRVLEKLYVKHVCNVDDTCISDLNVLMLPRPSEYLMLGADQYHTIFLQIQNFGGPAYLPKINITTHGQLATVKQSSACYEEDFVVQCDIWNDQRLVLQSNETHYLNITYDVSNINVNRVRVIANAFSSTPEDNMTDNAIDFSSTVFSCGKIEIIDTSGPGSQLLNVFQDDEEYLEVVRTFDIKNLGPSVLDNLILAIEYPTMISHYDDVSATTSDIVSPVVPQPESFEKNDISKPSLLKRMKIGNNATDEELEQLANDIFSSSKNANRTKTAIPEEISRRCVTANDFVPNTYTDLIRNISAKSKFEFNSNDINTIAETIRSKFKIAKLPATPEHSLKLSVNLHIKKADLENVLSQHKKDMMVYHIRFSVENGVCDPDNENCILSIVSTRIFVMELIVKSVPLKKAQTWIYAVIFLLAVLVYFLIALILYKIGFFKRKKHEEVKDFKRQSIMRQSMRITALPDYAGLQYFSGDEINDMPADVITNDQVESEQLRRPDDEDVAYDVEDSF